MSNTDSDIIVKRNELITACYKLTRFEYLILLQALTAVDSSAEITDDHMYEIDVASLINSSAGIHTDAYADFKAACLRLFDRKLTIDNEFQTVTRFVQTVKYKDSEARILIRFSKDILPYLSQIKANYTKYRFRHVVNFKSSYSLRFYQLLIQYMPKYNTRLITIDWLRVHFELPRSYERINNLKAKVIDKAVEEINRYSDITISYKQVKTGKRVTGFVFTMKSKTVDKLDVELHARPGESYTEAKTRLSQQLA